MCWAKVPCYTGGRNNISLTVTGCVEEMRLIFQSTPESEPIREGGTASGEAAKALEDNIEAYPHDPGTERDLLKHTKVSQGNN